MYLGKMLVAAVLFSAAAVGAVTSAGSAEASTTRASRHQVMPTVGAPRPVHQALSLRIAPLGDSITLGLGDSSGCPNGPDGYRWKLYDRLAGQGLVANYVGSQRSGCEPNPAHEGHSGWTIDEVRGLLNDSWWSTYHPDYALVDLGTNDCDPVKHPDLATGGAARLGTFVQLLLDHGVRGVVVAKLALVTVNQASADCQTVINQQLPGVLAPFGNRVTIADMSVLTGAQLADGVHPDPVGYDWMSYQWDTAFGRLLLGLGVFGPLAPTACPLPTCP